MIPDTLVDEVRERADIVAIIGEFIPLKKKGRDYWANCPFHKEKTPSFHVVASRAFYKCFGCGESGDAFSFLMKYAGLGFQDAVRRVADRVGIEIPDTTDTRPAEDPHRLLYEAVAFAADHYGDLLRGEAGAKARAYLERRGIAAEVAERFRLGYAPDDWRALREAARRHGIEDEVLLEAGLIKTSERSEEPYDRLRDRLVFPITDAGGRIIAFGGRILGRAREGAPKYLNSPETPIYHKGRQLYGIAWAKSAIRRESTALVVEGYMDYVSLAACGIEHVVAGLGTAMTAEQAGLLGRYTRQALLLYDSDQAGLRATFRTADALLAARVHPLVVTLPPGEDPDSLVRSGGAATLRPYLDDAVDVLDRKLTILEERGYFEGAEGTRKALDGLLPTLRAVVDPVLRDIYVSRVVERTGVTRDTLEAELRAERSTRRIDAARPVARATARPVGVSGQRKLLLLLLRDEARIPEAAARVDPAEFTDPTLREIFEAIRREGGARDEEPMARRLGPAARAQLEALQGDPELLTDADQILEDSINDIKAEGLFRRLDDLDAAISAPPTGADDEDKHALLMQKFEIMHKLRELGYTVERLYQKRVRPNRTQSTE